MCENDLFYSINMHTKVCMLKLFTILASIHDIVLHIYTFKMSLLRKAVFCKYVWWTKTVFAEAGILKHSSKSVNKKNIPQISYFETECCQIFSHLAQ